jgi:large conductance mechanosensitive channel
MLKDFKAFVLRGNVVDLAIAVVIGAAFGAVVKAFISGLVTPLLAIPGNAASLADLKFTISDSQFLYGSVLDAIVNFVVVAAVLYFFVVRPVNILMARRKTEPEVLATTRDCPYCLSSIPLAATRCAFCTADVSSGAG